MMGSTVRIALILVAAAAVYLCKPELASNVSDFALALGAGYAAWEYLRGYRKEQRANANQADEGTADDIREQARQIYAQLGMQAPWLLLAALFFCALKLWALIGQIPVVGNTLWPA